MARIWIAGDVETTGVSNTDKVIELAYIAFDDDMNELYRGESLINPEMPIPSGASAVNGITNKMVAECPTIEQFMAANDNPLAAEDAILVAYNSSFDFRFLKAHMHEGTADHMCTMRLSKMIWPGLDSYKMQALKYSQELPEVEGDAHRAMADVELMVHLMRRMVEVTGLSLADLREKERAQAKVDNNLWQFGKHRGKPLNHDMGYVRWALKNMDNMSPELRAKLEAL